MKRADVMALCPSITKDQLDEIMKLHGEDIEDTKKKFDGFINPADHKKVTDELAVLKSAPPPKAELSTEQLAELDNLRNYKNTTETKLLNDSKKTALIKGLTTFKAHPDAIELLSLKFDLNKIELDDKGEIKGFDALVKPIQEAHRKFFGIEQFAGATPGKTPAQQYSGQTEPQNLEDALRLSYLKKN